MTEKQTTVATCPNCRGKGHVLVGASLLGGPIIWFAAMFERNDPRGISRETCPRCDGEGFVEFYR